jgi:hypothetical protein
MEPAAIAALVIASLGTVAWWMIRNWARTWETRISAQDRRLEIHDNRLNEHDTLHAITSANLEHIREQVDETHDDVKRILSGSVNRKA